MSGLANADTRNSPMLADNGSLDGLLGGLNYSAIQAQSPTKPSVLMNNNNRGRNHNLGFSVGALNFKS